MNNLQEISSEIGGAVDRAGIDNLSFFAQSTSSISDTHGRLSVPMIESTTHRDVAALTDAANAIAPMAMFGTLRRGSRNSIVMRYWRPNGFGAHRFDPEELPRLLMPEAAGTLQSSSEEIRSGETAALDADRLQRFASLAEFGSFLSFTPGFYKSTDVLIARRIADRLALGLSRDRATC